MQREILQRLTGQVLNWNTHHCAIRNRVFLLGRAAEELPTAQRTVAGGYFPELAVNQEELGEVLEQVKLQLS